MKLANHAGRAALVLDDGIADVAKASDGRFGPDLGSVYDDWDAFVDFAATVTTATDALVEADLGCPVPAPRQVFAIGLNYRSHAEESGMALPEVPATFTKYPASLGGPFDDIEIVGGSVDWEVELVVVIGRRADRVAEADAWSHVAGLTVGQDISDRKLQFAAGAQFSLGKSRRGYGPMGPWLVTLDEVPNPDDLAPRLLGGRRGGAGRPHQRPRVQRAEPHRPALRRAPAPARRRHLHGHPGGGRREPQATAVPPARQRRSRRGSKASARSGTGACDGRVPQPLRPAQPRRDLRRRTRSPSSSPTSARCR